MDWSRTGISLAAEEVVDILGYMEDKVAFVGDGIEDRLGDTADRPAEVEEVVHIPDNIAVEGTDDRETGVEEDTADRDCGDSVDIGNIVHGHQQDMVDRHFAGIEAQEKYNMPEGEGELGEQPSVKTLKC